MKKNVIIHVPHSSKYLPHEFFMQELLLNKKEIDSFNDEACDKFVNKLIPLFYSKIVSKVSRIFCDMERFKDDALEEMSSRGMGVIYERNLEDKKFISFSDEYKNKVIKKYYDKYHKKIDKITLKKLKKYSKVIFVDLHSFGDQMVKKLFDLENSPDICIGIDSQYTPNELKKYTKEFFESKTYTAMYNYPYKGTLVPNVVMKNNIKGTISIMIEINKRIYLNENGTIDKQKFKKLKKVIKEYLKNISLIF